MDQIKRPISYSNRLSVNPLSVWLIGFPPGFELSRHLIRPRATFGSRKPGDGGAAGRVSPRDSKRTARWQAPVTQPAVRLQQRPLLRVCRTAAAATPAPGRCTLPEPPRTPRPSGPAQHAQRMRLTAAPSRNTGEVAVLQSLPDHSMAQLHKIRKSSVALLSRNDIGFMW